MSSLLDQCISASALYEKQLQAFITTGCTSIDQCLKGGIIRNSITEIAGEASAGKTQIAIQLAVNSILPENLHGVDGKTLYVQITGSFPLVRLQSIATEFCKRYPQYSISDITENIYIQDIQDIDSLISLLDTLDNRLESDHGNPIRLVILDSIASVFRGSDSVDYIKRSEIIRHLYYQMNLLCQNHNLTFLILNQISSCYDDSLSLKNTGISSIPSLGSTVTQFTHNRYMICRRNSTFPSLSVLSNAEYKGVFDENHSNTATEDIRDLYILFSPYIGCRKTSFTITKQGVVSI